MAMCGFDRDGRISCTLLLTCRTSPGRVGSGQDTSAPAPMIPCAKGTLSTMSRIVIAIVCQPLAARPWKKVFRALSGST